MPHIPESVTRDSLAQRLEVLEPGLRLVGTEVRLPSTQGAAGIMDLVAQDQTGMLVVIEVKTRRATTREAVQEILKYARLFADSRGLGPDDVRCLIASTDWHELQHSVAQLRVGSPHRIEGYELHLDSEGAVTSATRRRFTGLPPILTVWPEHLVFVYDDADERDRGIRQLQARLQELDVPDALIWPHEHTGHKPLMYPYNSYLALGVLNGGEDTHETRRTANSLAAMAQGGAAREVEAAGPETFLAMESSYRRGAPLRLGRFTDERIWSTDQLIRRVGGEGRAVGRRYTDSARPIDTARWNRMKETSFVFLNDNETWTNALKLAFERSETFAPEEVVTLYLFDLMDVVWTLRTVPEYGLSFVPMLRYTQEGPMEVQFTMLGALHQVRRAGLLHLDIATRLLGGPESYLASRMTKTTATCSPLIIDQLGLAYGTFVHQDNRLWTLTIDPTGTEEAQLTPLHGAPIFLPDFLKRRPDILDWVTTMCPDLDDYSDVLSFTYDAG